MVELDNKREAAFNKEYQAYLEGSHTLKADERRQLGMRLAKTLHHKQLYAMDSSGALERRFWNWGKTLELAKELKQNKLLSQHKALIPELTKSAKAESSKHTIDRLINLCARLQKENESLREREARLLKERSKLLEKSEMARNRVEHMIVRLKNLNTEG